MQRRATPLSSPTPVHQRISSLFPRSTVPTSTSATDDRTPCDGRGDVLVITTYVALQLWERDDHVAPSAALRPRSHHPQKDLTITSVKIPSYRVSCRPPPIPYPTTTTSQNSPAGRESSTSTHRDAQESLLNRVLRLRPERLHPPTASVTSATTTHYSVTVTPTEIATRSVNAGLS